MDEKLYKKTKKLLKKWGVTDAEAPRKGLSGYGRVRK